MKRSPYLNRKSKKWQKSKQKQTPPPPPPNPFFFFLLCYFFFYLFLSPLSLSFFLFSPPNMDLHSTTSPLHSFSIFVSFLLFSSFFFPFSFSAEPPDASFLLLLLLFLLPLLLSLTSSCSSCSSCFATVWRWRCLLWVLPSSTFFVFRE